MRSRDRLRDRVRVTCCDRLSGRFSTTVSKSLHQRETQGTSASLHHNRYSIARSTDEAMRRSRGEGEREREPSDGPRRAAAGCS